MLTDLICSFLPVVVLWGIKIRLKIKVLVCGLMSLGLMYVAVLTFPRSSLIDSSAAICAALRAASLGISTVDLSYDYAIASIYSK